MKLTLSLFYFILIYTPIFGQSQGINTLWMMGYGGSSATLPYGGIDMNFFSGAPTINYLTREIEFKRAVSTIAGTGGNLLFCTNGVYIADATHDTMQNGSGINPGGYVNFVPDGLLIPQGALILKKPGFNSLYYLLYNQR